MTNIPQEQLLCTSQQRSKPDSITAVRIDEDAQTGEKALGLAHAQFPMKMVDGVWIQLHLPTHEKLLVLAAGGGGKAGGETFRLEYANNFEGSIQVEEEEEGGEEGGGEGERGEGEGGGRLTDGEGGEPPKRQRR
jgi:hypothetical protein